MYFEKYCTKRPKSYHIAANYHMIDFQSIYTDLTPSNERVLNCDLGQFSYTVLAMVVTNF